MKRSTEGAQNHETDKNKEMLLVLRSFRMDSLAINYRVR